ncbi:MAG: single-stranded DNA-binding protein [Clostridia bacterium]|nr:single-stranded DNA-binding protein [Clostridia bacterium]
MANFNLNKVILGGRITAEPEIKQTPSGTSVLSFSVAVNRRFASKSNDGSQPQADFINVTAWRQTAEFISRFFHKGSSICIVGSIQTRTWTDQQGAKRYATEVVADEAYFVDSKGEATYAPAAGNIAGDAYGTPAFSTDASAPKFEEVAGDEDLPF